MRSFLACVLRGVSLPACILSGLACQEARLTEPPVIYSAPYTTTLEDERVRLSVTRQWAAQGGETWMVVYLVATNLTDAPLQRGFSWFQYLLRDDTGSDYMFYRPVDRTSRPIHDEPPWNAGVSLSTEVLGLRFYPRHATGPYNDVVVRVLYQGDQGTEHVLEAVVPFLPRQEP